MMVVKLLNLKNLTKSDQEEMYNHINSNIMNNLNTTIDKIAMSEFGHALLSTW